MKSMWTSHADLPVGRAPLEGARGENAGVSFYRNRIDIGLPPANLPNDKVMVRGKDFVLVVN